MNSYPPSASYHITPTHHHPGLSQRIRGQEAGRLYRRALELNSTDQRWRKQLKRFLEEHPERKQASDHEDGNSFP